VHQQFATRTSTMLKQVFEKKYLIQDSAIQIEWRITDETRTIAGFDCRKAVGKMFDSLYVVAFYTDQIMAPAGPEQYSGLPGTILGLGFPRFYTTIFATKVELKVPAPAELTPPAKGQRIKRRELMTQIKEVFKWGSEEERQKGFWSVIL
jgi:GLPGLI family protein